MRHLLHRVCHKVTLNVLAQADQHRIVVGKGTGCIQHVPQPHHLTVGVGNLNAHGRFTGNGCQQTHVVSGHRIGQVGLEVGNFGHLHAGTEFHLIASHCRPTREPRHHRVHIELTEHISDGLDHAVIRLGTGFRRVTRNQQLCARKLIVAVHRPRLRRRHILLLFALGCGRRHGRCINPGTRDNRGTHSLTARSHSITCCFRLLSDARPCRSNGRTGTRRSSINTGGGCGLLLRFLRGLLAPPLRLGSCISDGRHFVSIGQRRLTSFQHRRRFFNGVVIHW